MLSRLRQYGAHICFRDAAARHLLHRMQTQEGGAVVLVPGCHPEILPEPPSLVTVAAPGHKPTADSPTYPTNPHGRACSYAADTLSRSVSRWRGATIWSPIGRPEADMPAGTEAAG